MPVCKKGDTISYETKTIAVGLHIHVVTYSDKVVTRGYEKKMPMHKHA